MSLICWFLVRDLELVAYTSSGLNGLAFADVSLKFESLPKFGLCIALCLVLLVLFNEIF